MIHAQDGNQNAAELILSNAIDFLNAGLRILFVKNATPRDAKVGIISIQTAIELMAKYRLVREHGLGAIVRGKLPAGDLVAAAIAGDLKTIGYSECLKKIREDESFTEMEERLVARVQQLRNSLVHFTAQVNVEDVQNEVSWLLIRALGMFAAGQERDQGEQQTHERFLDPLNFGLLSVPDGKDVIYNHTITVGLGNNPYSVSNNTVKIDSVCLRNLVLWVGPGLINLEWNCKGVILVVRCLHRIPQLPELFRCRYFTRQSV